MAEAPACLRAAAAVMPAVQVRAVLLAAGAPAVGAAAPGRVAVLAVASLAMEWKEREPLAVGVLARKICPVPREAPLAPQLRAMQGSQVPGSAALAGLVALRALAEHRGAVLGPALPICRVPR